MKASLQRGFISIEDIALSDDDIAIKVGKIVHEDTYTVTRAEKLNNDLALCLMLMLSYRRIAVNSGDGKLSFSDGILEAEYHGESVGSHFGSFRVALAADRKDRMESFLIDEEAEHVLKVIVRESGIELKEYFETSATKYE